LGWQLLRQFLGHEEGPLDGRGDIILDDHTDCGIGETMKRYKYYEDAGHGWVAVPRRMVSNLGLIDTTTGYSHQSKSGRVVYLEEDVDAPRFAEAYQKRFGTKPEFESRYMGRTGRIRRYPEYSKVPPLRPIRM